MPNFCVHCGAELKAEAAFCPGCGLPIAGPQAGAQPHLFPDSASLGLPEGIYRDADGAYHWFYRMNMRKNYTVPIAFFKVMGLVGGLLGALMCIIHLANDDVDYIPTTLLLILACFGGLCLLFVIVWLCMAAARGGWYIVEHMMNERKVVYLSTPEEARKMRQVGALNFVLGAATGDLTALGLGSGEWAGERFDSDYADVKSIQAVRRRDLIKVNNLLQRNTIYAAPHQFDFVYNYIVAHCPNAKIQ